MMMMQGASPGSITDDDKQQLINMMKNINGTSNGQFQNNGKMIGTIGMNGGSAHSTANIAPPEANMNNGGGGGGGTPLPIKNTSKLTGGHQNTTTPMTSH